MHHKLCDGTLMCAALSGDVATETRAMSMSAPEALAEQDEYGAVSSNDEFCSKNEEICIKNEELCFKNDGFSRRLCIWRRWAGTLRWRK